MTAQRGLDLHFTDLQMIWHLVERKAEMAIEQDDQKVGPAAADQEQSQDADLGTGACVWAGPIPAR
ncbi:hypothetical protein [Pseudomonas citronellolis]|uniref:hypothetical protein n=1 Tax=Pseudomonas citronellolis TaxID=53408 RepID=UPI0021C0E353|nr:hypothetical protein [Pseudomonas citronellolis]UXJ50290.1 hypothetical protein N5P21_20105 [Pseudomonas citronellolis]